MVTELVDTRRWTYFYILFKYGKKSVSFDDDLGMVVIEIDATYDDITDDDRNILSHFGCFYDAERDAWICPD